MDAGPGVVWCEARLTNHAELVADLGLDPAAGDAAVVAAAVARWGDHAPRHLLGAYAYAVARPAGTVVTRDALGVMPAFWARDTTGAVHVSDCLATLAAIDGVDTTPDNLYLAAESLGVSGLCADHSTMVGVHRVPPGTSVHIGAAGSVSRRWWRPEDVVARPKVGVCEAAAELRDLLGVAVADHLAMVRRREGDTGLCGVAAHVSGGLDSTVVAFLAADVLAESGHVLRAALSWSPQYGDDHLAAGAVAEFGFDERLVVEDLACQLGTQAHFAPRVIEFAPWMQAEDPTLFPRATVRRESQSAPTLAGMGVSHVLSGWGGDEFVSFNGRGTNRAIVRSANVGAMRSAYSDRRRRGMSRIRALGATLAPGLPWWLGPSNRPTQSPVLAEHEAGVAAAFPGLSADFVRHQQQLAQASGPRAIQLALIERGHLTRRIESWHQVAVRFGYSYGYPLLDRRLVEWALAVPPEVFRNGVHSRRVFRLAVADLVPDTVRSSQKVDPVLFAAAAHNPTADEAQRSDPTV